MNINDTETLKTVEGNRKMGFIERLHSRGQQLCKFIGTKESVYIRKEINSQQDWFRSTFWLGRLPPYEKTPVIAVT